MKKKIFIDDLPRWESGKNKGKIKWSDTIGYIIKFIYNCIEGELEIVGYKPKGQFLYIKYLDKEPFEINTNSFLQCNLNKLLKLKTNDFKVEIGAQFKDDKRDITITDKEYRKDNKGINRKWYKYTCNKCGWTEGWIIEGHLLTERNGCSCCCGRTVVKGINDIWTTDTEFAKLLNNKDDGYVNTKSSTKICYFKCKNCENTRALELNYAYKTFLEFGNISCEKCSDNISYSEKLMIRLLNELNIDFTHQLTNSYFQWCSTKRYDFYFKINNEEYIIETHGAQHYEKNKFKFDLKEQQKNDKFKKELALNNGIKEENYIVIDCRKSNPEYIKKNVLKSKLNNMFELNKIDWIKIFKSIGNSLIKEVCNFKADNIELSTLDIGNHFGLSRNTVTSYLKIGDINGWCEYNAKEEMINSNKKLNKNGKKIEIFKNDISFGIFPSARELDRQSIDLFGTRIGFYGISLVLRGVKDIYKGFTFKYV